MRKRKNSLPEVDNQIKSLQRLIKSGSMDRIYGRGKNVNTLSTDNSRRRSIYTGVSKNGQNWQVLINMGKFKKYIGTYPSEKEAAIAYDFYSVWLHLTKAKTNFNYDSNMLVDMISNFKSNNNKFIAAEFITVV